MIKKTLKLLVFAPVILFTSYIYIRTMMFPEADFIEFGSFTENILFYFFNTKNIDDLSDNYTLTITRLFPIIVIIMIFGTYIYKEFTVENIYHLVRYKTRFKLYTYYVIKLGLYCFIEAILFSFFVLFFITQGRFTEINLLNILNLTITSFSVIFGFAILQNIISLKLGTLYGFFSMCIVFLISTKVALDILSKTSSIGIHEKIFMPFLLFFMSTYKNHSFGFLLLSCLISSTLVVGIGFSFVKSANIGLSDKELI